MTDNAAPVANSGEAVTFRADFPQLEFYYTNVCTIIAGNQNGCLFCFALP